MQRYLLGGVIFLAVAGAGLEWKVKAQALASGTPGAIVLERILVKVNGGLITQTDLEEAQINELRARPLPPQTDADLRRLIEEMTPALIANAVDQELLVQRGREMGYTLGDEQFEEILEGIKEENGMTDEQLISALEIEQGMTLAQLRRVMERQMLVGQVQEIQVLRRVRMTDTEAEEYYESNLDEFSEPATVTLREILIAVPVENSGLNVARDNQARLTAEEAFTRVTAGDDFEQVVSEMSDSASSANGGLIGPIPVGDVAEEIRARIEPLEEGEISEVTRTPAGYQILKLESIYTPAPTSFEEVRDEIVNNVFNDRRIEALETFIDTLRSEAIIEWKDEGLRTLYEQFLATREAISQP
ncbi:MAG: hypothetical protein CL484_02205 [Acidobacteria bacterium]|mgnify:CR=1 FL=1|nr:hypothetical protein [Acidobacteriota bacterium]|tara:strand:+ start:7912 stop:8991 length:1080 start_codon:yes stop_codon:yes gene_type:complete